jgi:hypothetical protein
MWNAVACNVLRRKPSTLRNVTVATTREKEFAATFFSFPAQQRMIGKQFQGSTHTEELRGGSGRVFFGDEVEEPLKIAHCPFSYFDARHECGLGRRALAPATRFSR